MLFTELGLAPTILSAIDNKGYKSPTPIQQQAIPAILANNDVMAAAQTGTGKTAGFTLPLIHNLMQGKPAKANQVRALVLTPTRELAAQVSESIATYGSQTPLKSQVVFGGVKINPQMMALRKGVDILVATPGRLLDLYQQNAIKFEQLEVLVLDEADRMLDMGFIADIRKILKLLPKQRQNLMFSATFSPEIRELAKGLMNEPLEISVTPKNETAKTVEQWLIPVDQNQKIKLLVKTIKQHADSQILVFSRTKHGANRIAQRLSKKNISAAAIHGDKSQAARTKALAGFKDKSIQILVATDIAARGIDIEQLPLVINFDLPQVAEDYVHRIGRTGRAGSTGLAVSFVNAEEFNNLNDIEQLIQQHIPRKNDEEFVPTVMLADSKTIKPPKKKKPKKHKVKNKETNKNETIAPNDSNQPNNNSKAKETANRKNKTNRNSGSNKGRFQATGQSKEQKGQGNKSRNKPEQSKAKRQQVRRKKGQLG